MSIMKRINLLLFSNCLHFICVDFFNDTSFTIPSQTELKKLAIDYNIRKPFLKLVPISIKEEKQKQNKKSIIISFEILIFWNK